MPHSSAIHDHVSSGYEPVWEAFVENFERRGEVGASVCVYHQGQKVVDLWGGWADVESKTPWGEDHIGIIFSSTKGLAALCMLVLHDRGRLDYDAPVAEYWPEFAWGGKQHITVRMLLNHRSGLSGLDRPLSLSDLEKPAHMAAACVAQQPMWEPGSAQGYGAISWGILVGELFRRVAGESLGRFLQREIAGPLGADAFLGLPPEHESRFATLYPTTTRERITQIIPRALFSPKVEGRVYRSVLYGSGGGVGRRAFGNPKELGPDGLHNFNSPRVHRMELPWSNGIANGRGLARIYAALANGGELDGVRIVSQAAAKLPHERGSWEHDRIMCKPMGFSLGFVKEQTHLFSPNTNSFGHPGAGGALGWCDPDQGVSIGYVMNKMDFHIRSKRALALAHAINSCL